MEELQKAWELARSFPGLLPPPGSTYIGKLERGGTTYHFYRTRETETPYLYETESGNAFKKKMHNAKKGTGKAGTNPAQ